MARKGKADTMPPAPARAFRLYPEAQHWWSLADYGAVLDVVERLKARSVLEFGPGSSTLALIEGGATWIDTCEDDPHYFTVYRERLERRFTGVHVRPYRWRPLPSIIGVDAMRYDLGLIDGPKETERRPAVLVYAIERCARVLVPLEETPELTGRGFMRASVERFAKFFMRPVEWIEGTGPLAGAFALIGPRC